MATKNSSCSSSTARTCLCSPSTHPGSFRCGLHRGGYRKVSATKSTAAHINKMDSKNNNEKKMMMLNTASKTNLIKAFLMQIIKPASHDLQRRRNFQPNKPTRFCQMNCPQNNDHRVAVS